MHGLIMKYLSRHLGVASLLLGAFSCTVIVLLFASLLYELPEPLEAIAFHVFLSPLIAFPALVIGIIAYSGVGKQKDPVGKRYALWGIILSSLYWILFLVQYNMRIPGSGW
jgi:uncharacterized BrkB/YihY/UPF0761 family membrane protein